MYVFRYNYTCVGLDVVVYLIQVNVVCLKSLEALFTAL